MKTIISILTILSFTFGAWLYIDNKKADCDDLKKVENKIDYEILSNQLDRTQEKIDKLKDKYENRKMDSTAKESLRDLEQRKGNIERKLKILEK